MQHGHTWHCFVSMWIVCPGGHWNGGGLLGPLHFRSPVSVKVDDRLCLGAGTTLKIVS